MPDTDIALISGLAALFSRSSQDPEYARLAALLSSGLDRPVNVFSLTDPQKAWLILGLAQNGSLGRTRGNIFRPCILVPDELRARSLATDLKALSDKPVLVYRSREMNLTDSEAASREFEMQRLSILTRWLASDDVIMIVSRRRYSKNHAPGLSSKEHAEFKNRRPDRC
jgi:hypothetical protein